MVNIVKPW